MSMPGQIRLHMRASAPDCALKKRRVSPTRSWRHQGNHSERRTERRFSTTYGLPYSGINLTYSNAGTIGSSDAESSFN